MSEVEKLGGEGDDSVKAELSEAVMTARIEEFLGRC